MPNRLGQDLIDLGNMPDAYDKHFILTNDIDLKDRSWQGVLIDRFTGTLDGKGHALKNLTVVGGSIAGLICMVEDGAIVRNLSLADALVLSTYTADLFVDNEGLISNCHSTGRIAGWSAVGGLVGGNQGEIVDCSSSATVESVHLIRGLTACVRDLFLMGHECHAWVNCVLKKSEAPDLKTYLETTLDRRV